jgi:hypothetical protein
LALTPPLGHTQSAHGSGSNPAATLSKLKDREVIVKVGDLDTVKTFRRLKSSETKHQAEKARQKVAREDATATLAATQFVVA